MENKKGEVIGLCEVRPFEGNINVQYIESQPNGKYKFVGQTMLKNLAQILFHSRFDMTIICPRPEADTFYSETCGFKSYRDKKGYILKQADMNNFIERVEKRTNEIEAGF